MMPSMPPMLCLMPPHAFSPVPYTMLYAPCFLVYPPYASLPSSFCCPTLFVRNRGRLHFMSPVDVMHQTGLVQ